MPDEPDDDELLRRWQDGDPAAGHDLVARHFLPVFRFFATKLAEEAEDLTQKTFADLHRTVVAPKGDAIQSFRAYAMRTARNNLWAHLRTRTTRERLFDPTAYSLAQMMPEATPSEAVGQKREERLLLGGLRRIPLEAQVTLELFYWEELPVRDIAEIMEVQPGTVMSRLARAREKLRAAIADLTDEPALLESTMTNLDGWARKVRDAFELDR